MKVRSKLALTSGLGLLILLGVFYAGGRMVVLFSLKQAANSLIRSLPEVRRTVDNEQQHLTSLAVATAESAPLRALLNNEPHYLPQGTTNDWNVTLLDRLGVDMVAVATTSGSVRSEWFRLAQSEAEPAEAADEQHAASDLEQHLSPGMRLVAGFNSGEFKATSGLLALPGGTMLVAVAPVRQTAGENAGWLGMVVVGRELDNANLLRRITPGFPTLTTTRQEETAISHAGRRERLTEEIVAESFVFDIPAMWRASEPVRARLPLYDIYGHPVVSLMVDLPHSFKGLAELALSWLTLFIACVGSLYVIPLFVVQGRTVLNPLTRLVADIQGLGSERPGKRRLNWKRRDEFGIVARTIDEMLTAIDDDQEKLAAHNAHMRALLTTTPDLIFIVNREGVVTEIATQQGGRVSRVFGDPSVGLDLSQPNTEAPLAGALFTERIVEVLNSGQLQFFEYNLKRNGPTPSWVEVRMARLDQHQVMVLVRDVTDRHRALHERARIEAKMAQLQKTESLGILAGGMAHDFNNVLTVILGNLDALTQERLSDASQEAVENIRLAMIRASSLTRQILSYAGQGNFTFEEVNLNELLQDLVRLMRRTIAPQIELLTGFGEKMPLIRADATQIWQVVMNLILNASDAMSSLSGTISLTTSHVTPEAARLESYHSQHPLAVGDYALIEVNDTGHGMDSRTLERIFDPFFTTKSMGRGLGLSACLGIVRAHGGGINVSSKSGEGTRFRILLPFARDTEGALRFPAPPPLPEAVAADPGAAPPSQSECKVESETRQGIKVLVADDDPAIIRLIEIILRGRKLEIASAPNGEAALKLFDRAPESFDLALIDANMGPGMNGSETCAALRARVASLPAIVMSGYREHEVSLHDPATVTQFLAKPFTSRDLLAVIDKALENRATDRPAKGV